METTNRLCIDGLTSKGFKFAYQNIHSLLRNIDEIKSFSQRT